MRARTASGFAGGSAGGSATQRTRVCGRAARMMRCPHVAGRWENEERESVTGKVKADILEGAESGAMNDCVMLAHSVG